MTQMSRTMLLLLALALVASPGALAQQGPPPGYTSATDYAQDYADDQVQEAKRDPVGYATTRDAVNETGHTLWLACWAAYDATGHVADPVCAQFFTAPVTVQPAAEPQAEITSIVNGTGALNLTDEVLDAVNDTLADPANALQQAERVAKAVLGFVLGVVVFVLDLLGLGALGVAGGLLGAGQGLLDLVQLPLDGLALGGDALGDAGGVLADAGTALGAAVSAVGDAAQDGVQSIVSTVARLGDGLVAALAAGGQGVQRSLGLLGDAAHWTSGQGADAVTALGGGLHGLGATVADAVSSSASAIGTGAQSIGDAAQAVGDEARSAVRTAVDAIAGIFADESEPARVAGQELPVDGGVQERKETLLQRLLGSL